uniref:Uncharacterized protein n=1 Tax=Glossina palpalis gambiensis TaxID=67801 RepID=A0A1B0BH42_9MUSC
MKFLGTVALEALKYRLKGRFRRILIESLERREEAYNLGKNTTFILELRKLHLCYDEPSIFTTLSHLTTIIIITCNTLSRLYDDTMQQSKKSILFANRFEVFHLLFPSLKLNYRSLALADIIF